MDAWRNIMQGGKQASARWLQIKHFGMKLSRPLSGAEIGTTIPGTCSSWPTQSCQETPGRRLIVLLQIVDFQVMSSGMPDSWLMLAIQLVQTELLWANQPDAFPLESRRATRMLFWKAIPLPTEQCLYHGFALNVSRPRWCGCVAARSPNLHLMPGARYENLSVTMCICQETGQPLLYMTFTTDILIWVWLPDF